MVAGIVFVFWNDRDRSTAGKKHIIVHPPLGSQRLEHTEQLSELTSLCPYPSANKVSISQAPTQAYTALSSTSGAQVTPGLEEEILNTVHSVKEEVASISMWNG